MTGPGGFSRLAQLVSTSGAGGQIVATYSVEPPSGGWSSAANGTYTVSMLAGQVQDTSSNAVAAGQLGSFTVSTPS